MTVILPGGRAGSWHVYGGQLLFLTSGVDGTLGDSGREVRHRHLTTSLLPPAGSRCVLPEAALVPEGAAGPLPTAASRGDGHHHHRGVRGEGSTADQGGPACGKGLGGGPLRLSWASPAWAGSRGGGRLHGNHPPAPPLSQALPGIGLGPRGLQVWVGTVMTPCVPPPPSGRPWQACAPDGGRRCTGSCKRPRRARPTLLEKAASHSSRICACSVRRRL